MTVAVLERSAGAAVRAVADGLDVPAWQVADADVAAQLRDVDHGIRLLEARAVELAAQAGQRGLPARHGCRRLTQWVQQVLPTAAAARVARLAGRAEALFTRPVAADLAATRAALLSGQISGEQADVITAAVAALVPPAVPPGTVDATTLDEAEELLLDHAHR